MKQRLFFPPLLLFLLVTSGLVLFGYQAPAYASEGDGPLFNNTYLSGTVTDMSGNPLPNISVRLLDPINMTSLSRTVDDGYGYTDENGQFEITNAAPGTYLLILEDYENGAYATTLYPNTLTPGDATRIVLRNADRVSIQATMNTAGRIDGTISLDHNATLRTLYVQAHRHIDGIGWVIMDTDYRSNYSDDASLGAFSLTGLPPGPYRLYFNGDAEVSSRDEIRYNGWYGGDDSAESGVDVLVTRDASTAVDWVFGDSSVLLSGNVVSTNNQPLSEIEVRLYKFNPDRLPGEEWGVTYDGYARTDASGNYQFRAQEPGHYKVGFSDYNQYVPVYNNNAPTLGAAPVIIVTDQDIDGIDAVMSLGGSLSGRVTAADGRLIAEVRGVTALRWNGSDAYFHTRGSRVTRNNLGTFLYKNMQPGEYLIQLRLSLRNGMDIDYWLGGDGTRETAQHVTITDGQTTEFGQIKLDNYTGSIQGRATDSLGNALSNYRVVMRLDLGNSYEFADVRTDANGYYQLTDLPAGEYDLLVFNDSEKRWTIDATRLQNGTTFGRIALDKGASVEQDVTLDIGGALRGRVTSPHQFQYLTLSAQYKAPNGEWTGADSDWFGPSGWYSFVGLPEGEYVMRYSISASIYADRQFNGEGFFGADGVIVDNPDDATPFVVRSNSVTNDASANVTEVEFYEYHDNMPEMIGELHGRVTDNAGQPLEGVMVSLYRLATPPTRGGPYWTTYDATATTDANGNYAFTNLPIDEQYYADKWRIGFSGALIGYDTIYYGDTVVFDSAEIIELRAEAPSVSGLDASLNETGCQISICMPQ